MPLLTNNRHELFCRQYLLHGNASRAAIEVGYSENGAGQQAHKLLKRVDVQERLDELREVSSEKAEITDERWTAEMAALGFSSIADYLKIEADGRFSFDIANTPRAKLAAISEMQTYEKLEGSGDDAELVQITKLKLHPKIPALVKLGEKFKYTKSAAESVDRLAQLVAEINRTGVGRYPIASDFDTEDAH